MKHMARELLFLNSQQYLEKKSRLSLELLKCLESTMQELNAI